VVCVQCDTTANDNERPELAPGWMELIRLMVTSSHPLLLRFDSGRPHGRPLAYGTPAGLSLAARSGDGEPR
jgi:hypothetical protein